MFIRSFGPLVSTRVLYAWALLQPKVVWYGLVSVTRFFVFLGTYMSLLGLVDRFNVRELAELSCAALQRRSTSA